MKTILSTLIFSFLGLNIIFAKEELNFDDPKVQDQIIATATQKLESRENRDGEKIYYLPFNQVPYSGWWVEFYDNGQLRLIESYKDGLKDGPSILWSKYGEKAEHRYFKKHIMQSLDRWYENGQKIEELTYKEGKLWSAKCWKMDGEKCPVTNLKDGNGVKKVYLANGIDIGPATYKNGEKVKD